MDYSILGAGYAVVGLPCSYILHFLLTFQPERANIRAVAPRRWGSKNRQSPRKRREGVGSLVAISIGGGPRPMWPRTTGNGDNLNHYLRIW